jgi:replicative DNA helicase
MTNTLGIRFLRSVLAENATSVFRNAADPSLFLEEERPAFDAVASHLANYAKLPTLHALAVEGIVFPNDSSPQESPAYHSAQLRRRAAYNSINTRHPSLAAALKVKDMDTAIATLREMLAEASGKVEAANYSSLDAEAQLVIADYQFAKTHSGLRGVPLRWQSLNDATNGAMGGDLIVVAGRPGVGKSWTLLEMALDAHRHGRSVAFASMEMSLMQIARRWIGGMTGINPNDIRDGTVSHWSESTLMQSVANLATSAPVHLFRGDMKKSVDGIATMMDEFEPDILFVDAVYLLSPAGRKNGSISRWEAISEVIRELKQVALHKNRPIVVSVQFNRNQRDRPGRKNKEGGQFFDVPDLGDVAGSDSIPQDASLLIGQTLWPQPFSSSRRVLHLMKNREGETLSFGINFEFSPVNFSEIPLIEADAGTPVVDSSWML